jgi:two-component system chemotaxis response regulator CheY
MMAKRRLAGIPADGRLERRRRDKVAKTILIADDALFTRMMLRNILTENGYTAVVEAETGTEAIWAYNRWKPDLVIMAINMPEMDGMTAVRNILALDPQARIIICSALGEKQLMLEALEAGVKDFITKPFQPSKVVEVVKRVLS